MCYLNLPLYFLLVGLYVWGIFLLPPLFHIKDLFWDMVLCRTMSLLAVGAFYTHWASGLQLPDPPTCPHLLIPPTRTGCTSVLCATGAGCIFAMHATNRDSSPFLTVLRLVFLDGRGSLPASPGFILSQSSLRARSATTAIVGSS